MIMTVTLRYIDVRYLLPKRLAFAAGLDSGEVVIAGHSAAREESLDEDDVHDSKKGSGATVKAASVKDVVA